MDLFEAYKTRINSAETAYAKSHNGESLPATKKLMLARCLANTDSFLRESLQTSLGTQRADLGLFHKFCVNLTNVAVPALIAPEITLTFPLSTMSGYLTYVKYSAGSVKGNTDRSTVFNDPFRLGTVDEYYTSSKVVKNLTLTEETTSFAFSWTPVMPGTAYIAVGDDKYYDNGEGVLIKNPTSIQRRVVIDKTDGVIAGRGGEHLEVVFEGGEEAGTIVYAGTDAAITLTTGITGDVEFSYTYDNQVVPQNDLPILTASIDGIPLLAKARRVAIQYSQIAQYQAKTDYGFDLSKELSTQAVGQLQYEIDTEVCNTIINAAEEDEDLVWSKTLPIGVNKQDHYSGFAELIDIGAQKIYDKTKRHSPNYMIAASNILPVLNRIVGFTAAPRTNLNGPYFAGTLNGIKVYITPNIEAGKYVLGVNGNDQMTSACVFAPYMAVVPTSLLSTPDGGNAQGFSTLYDVKILNKDLLIAGKIVA